MQRILKWPSIITSVVLGFLILIPFIVLELVNVVWKFNLGFPFFLFILMWVNQTLFIFILLPIVRKQKSSKIFFLIRIVALAILAYTWIGIVSDQLPCFMGIPNCD